MIEAAEKTNQQVWRLKGITYVPHYTKPNVFVGPGWAAKTTNKLGETKYTPMEYTLLDLIAKQAVAGEMFLWPR
jgi:hypothetical protein